MGPLSVLIIGLLIIGLSISAGFVGARRRRERARIRELWDLWSELPPERRVSAFRDRLDQLDESPDADRPGAERARAEVGFFLGCAHLAERDAPNAARMFQVAYHADPALRVVLVLAFACLKVGAETFDELADRCRSTWRELGSPALGRTRRERLLLESGPEEGIDDVLERLPGSPLRTHTVHDTCGNDPRRS